MAGIYQEIGDADQDGAGLTAIHKGTEITKDIGGFWIGPSIEGLMALGTVRFVPEAMAPKQAVINGFQYDLPLHLSPNRRHLRSFYPEFKGRVPV